MSPVEHGEINDHATKEPSFAQAQEEPERQKPTVRLGQATKCRTQAPSDAKCREIALEILDLGVLLWEGRTYTGPKILENPIARHIDQNIRDIEDRQRDIELVARQLEVFDQAINLGIANVRAVDESQQPQTEKPRNLDAASIPSPKSVRSVSRGRVLTMCVSNLRVMRRSSAASIPIDSTRLKSAASM